MLYRAAATFLFAALAALTACGPPAPAGNGAGFTGDARTDALLAAAREEGTVSIYSSLPVEVMAAVTSAFEAKYGIRPTVWRGGSEEILQRSVAEARAGRIAADIVETAGAEVEAIAREHLLQKVSSPVLGELMPQAVAPERPWVASRLITFVTAYNTNLVGAAEAPSRFEDFRDPKWRGRLTVEANDFSWIMGMANALGETEALSLLRNIVATNGISVRDGHGLLTSMIVSGEVALTFTQYYEQAQHLKEIGAPIEVVFLDPVIAVNSALGVFAGAPHPNATQLFVDFYLTEGQDVLAAFDYIPTNLSRQNLPEGVELHIADVGQFLDEYDKWRGLHREIFAAAR